MTQRYNDTTLYYKNIYCTYTDITLIMSTISALSVHRSYELNCENVYRESHTRVRPCTCVCKNIKTNMTGMGVKVDRSER